jgi:precorrin-2/cobalt-factor-2 C20-methyltransferase
MPVGPDTLNTADLLRALAPDPDAPSGPPAVTLMGVGPGDPEWLTVAAVRAIAAAVACPVARPEAEGMAARIAAAWMRPDQRRRPLLFPMVEEADPRRQALACRGGGPGSRGGCRPGGGAAV